MKTTIDQTIAELEAERCALGKINFAAAKTHSQSDEVIARLAELDEQIQKARTAR